MRGVNPTFASSFGNPRDYAKVSVVIAAITLAGWFSPLSYHALGYVYLLAVIALSLTISRWPALAAAVLSGLTWDFFCVPPKFSLAGIHFDEGLLLTTYFAVALIGSQLTSLRAAADRAVLLMESEQMHQTLLDSVSHEIMTPLAVFRSAIEQVDTPDAAKRTRVVAEFKIALQRLDSLVGNLLNQNRLESGVLKPKMDWCEGHELVAAARRAVGIRIGDHPLSVVIPPDLPLFRADAALMEQAITQLLINASVHTPAATEIYVTAGASEDMNRILFTVSDNGPGLPPEIRDTIFEKFTRGPGAKKGGLGLGLSVAQGFMRAQGGEVTAGASPGGGARFTLSLPFDKSDTPPIG
jgi:two-component system sensor histidine kinase KdpD